MNIPRPLAIALWPLSLVYGSAAKLRAWLYKQGWLKQKRLNRPVISVGNITVGGTGKTPMVIWLAEKLLAEGKHVAILSRGYRGANGTSDEIELMRQRLQGRVQIWRWLGSLRGSAAPRSRRAWMFSFSMTGFSICNWPATWTLCWSIPRGLCDKNLSFPPAACENHRPR